MVASVAGTIGWLERGRQGCLDSVWAVFVFVSDALWDFETRGARNWNRYDRKSEGITRLKKGRLAEGTSWQLCAKTWSTSDVRGGEAADSK